MTTNANTLVPAAHPATGAANECILEIRKALAGRSLATLREMRAAGKKHEPRTTDSALVLAAIEAEIAGLNRGGRR